MHVKHTEQRHGRLRCLGPWLVIQASSNCLPSSHRALLQRSPQWSKLMLFDDQHNHLQHRANVQNEGQRHPDQYLVGLEPGAEICLDAQGNTHHCEAQGQVLGGFPPHGTYDTCREMKEQQEQGVEPWNQSASRVWPQIGCIAGNSIGEGGGELLIGHTRGDCVVRVVLAAHRCRSWQIKYSGGSPGT